MIETDRSLSLIESDTSLSLVEVDRSLSVFMNTPFSTFINSLTYFLFVKISHKFTYNNLFNKSIFRVI